MTIGVFVQCVIDKENANALVVRAQSVLGPSRAGNLEGFLSQCTFSEIFTFQKKSVRIMDMLCSRCPLSGVMRLSSLLALPAEQARWFPHGRAG